jgi:hypothetical protein
MHLLWSRVSDMKSALGRCVDIPSTSACTWQGANLGQRCVHLHECEFLGQIKAAALVSLPEICRDGSAEILAACGRLFAVDIATGPSYVHNLSVGWFAHLDMMRSFIAF